MLEKCKVFTGLLMAILLFNIQMALADFDIRVTCPDQYTVQSPYDGKIQGVHVRMGDTVEAGQKLYTMAPTELLATEPGVIVTIPAVPGANGAALKETYDGAVIQQPECPYYISAAIQQATMKTTYTVGEMVYLYATKTKHSGTGRIIRVKKYTYTIEVLTGDLMTGDYTSVFRDAEYNYRHCIGKGSVKNFDLTFYNYEGFAIDIIAQQGRSVQAGDVLLTYAPVPSLDVCSEDEAVVVSASRKEGVTLAPLDGFCLSGYFKTEDLDALLGAKNILISRAGDEKLEREASIFWISTAANDEGLFEVRFHCSDIDVAALRLGETLHGETE